MGATIIPFPLERRIPGGDKVVILSTTPYGPIIDLMKVERPCDTELPGEPLWPPPDLLR